MAGLRAYQRAQQLRRLRTAAGKGLGLGGPHGPHGVLESQQLVHPAQTARQPPAPRRVGKRVRVCQKLPERGAAVRHKFVPLAEKHDAETVVGNHAQADDGIAPDEKLNVHLPSPPVQYACKMV